MGKNKKQCASLNCSNPTRTVDHDFCSYCWFDTPPILKRRYYFAKIKKPSFLPTAITDIIRSQERRKKRATHPYRARN